MGYIVKGAGAGGIALGDRGPVSSVLQNVGLILATRRGSAPMYREFGLPMGFLDKPLPVAEALLAAELGEALSLFEPRAALAGVDFGGGAPGRLAPVVEVDVDDGQGA